VLRREFGDIPLAAVKAASEAAFAEYGNYMEKSAERARNIWRLPQRRSCPW
jgi:hypothetical protein